MQLKANELAPNDHRALGRLAESYRAMGENEAGEKEAYAAAIPLAESMMEINDQDWKTGAMLATYYVHSDRSGHLLAHLITYSFQLAFILENMLKLQEPLGYFVSTNSFALR